MTFVLLISESLFDDFCLTNQWEFVWWLLSY
jgi:hypothetical protein